MNKQKQTQNILEILEFLKENLVTKEYFEEKLGETKNDLMSHTDAFIGLHQKLDTELTALRSKYDRLELIVKKLMEHLQLDL